MGSPNHPTKMGRALPIAAPSGKMETRAQRTIVTGISFFLRGTTMPELPFT